MTFVNYQLGKQTECQHSNVNNYCDLTNRATSLQDVLWTAETPYFTTVQTFTLIWPVGLSTNIT